MKKRKKIILLLLIFVLLLPMDAFAALPSIARQDLDPDFKMTNGYQWNNSSSYPTLFYTVNHSGMYRTDYMYEMNWYVRINGTRNSKTLELMRPRNAGGEGRTFALPSDMSYWSSALNADYNYVSTQAASAATIRNNYDGHSARRVYSRDLGKWTGSIVGLSGTGMFDGAPPSGNGHEMQEVTFTTTKKPTGTITPPASVTAGQSFTVNFTGQEYYPHSTYGTSPKIDYKISLDGKVITSGSKYSTTFSASHTVSTGICSPGTHNFQLSVTDIVGRTQVANKAINVTGTDCSYVPPPTTTEPPPPPPPPPPTSGTNGPPVPIFSWNPSTIYTDTNVTFTNNSYDPDNDPIQYFWTALRPDSSGGWVEFSREKYPSRIFDQEGTWQIELLVFDGNSVGRLRKPLTVIGRNAPPTITLNYSPTTLFEGDTVNLTAVANDPDGDLMTVKIERNVNGSWVNLETDTGVTSGQAVTHQRIVAPEPYNVRATATDPSGASAQATVVFSPSPLEIRGAVNHTPEWKEMHLAAGHDLSQFYAGERFMTEAVVTDHPISEVRVLFEGEQITGNFLNLAAPMLPQAHPRYEAEVYDSSMGTPSEHLKDGPVEFVFIAEWDNGVVKQHTVSVNIVSDVYRAFDFYRSN